MDFAFFIIFSIGNVGIGIKGANGIIYLIRIMIKIRVVKDMVERGIFTIKGFKERIGNI